MNQQGSDFFPHSDIPDTNVFPGGTFEFEWTGLEDGYSQNSGKRMFKAQFTCVQPANLAGMSHWENYVCGTDTNLKDVNPAAMGTRNMKQAMNASQIPANTSVAQIVSLVNQNKPHLMITLSYYQEKDGEYAGQDRNRIVGYDKLGARPVQILTQTKGTGGSGAPVISGAPAPMGAPTNPQAVSASPPASVPPIQQTTIVPPQPVQAAPIQSQIQPVPAPPVQAPPVAGPPTTAQAPPVVAPTVPPQAPPQAEQPPPVAADLLHCTICKQNVPASQYEQHVMEHAQAGHMG